MNLTLSLDEDVLRRARERAETLGTTVNQLVRDYLQGIAAEGDRQADAAEFVRLSRLSGGDSKGWKFNRNELHER